MIYTYPGSHNTTKMRLSDEEEEEEEESDQSRLSECIITEIIFVHRK